MRQYSDTQNKDYRNEYFHIYLCDYHGALGGLLKAPELRHVWNYDDYDDLIGEAGLVPEEPYIGNEVAEAALKTAFDKRIPKEIDWDDPTEAFQGDVWSLTIWPQSDTPSKYTLDILNNWIAAVKDPGSHFGCGGDDSTFDYDPDMVYVIWQLATTLHQRFPLLGANTIYNEFDHWVSTESGLASVIQEDQISLYDLID